MEQDLEALSARCDFCEATLESFKKEALVYMRHKKGNGHVDMRHTTDMRHSYNLLLDILAPTDCIINLFKTIATAEPNSALQETLFEVSARYSSIRDQLNIYLECEEQTRMIIDEAKQCIVAPTRVRVVLKPTKHSVVAIV